TNHGAQSDVVDRAQNAITMATAVKRDLELTRQISGEIFTEESVSDAVRIRPHVEHFIRSDACPGAGGDVPDGVVASLAIGQANVGEGVHQVRYAREGYEMILDVLTRGEVSLAASEFVSDTPHLLELTRGEHATRDLASHHLDTLLALSVNAMLQSER